MSKIHVVLPAVLLAVVCSSAAAQGIEQTPPVEAPNRYDIFQIEGVLYRMDKRTGGVEQMFKSPQGIVWKRIDTPNVQPAPVNPNPQNPLIPPPDQTLNNIQGLQPPAARKPVIEEVITPADVTESARNNSRAEISAYASKIGTWLVVKSDERIKGVIKVQNLGERKLKALEVTMTVPVIGREKPEEYHFLFSDAPNATYAAPLPSVAGVQAPILACPVDVPGPAGGMKGGPEVKISFIKFAD